MPGRRYKKKAKGRYRKRKRYAQPKALSMGARVFPKTMMRKLVYYIPLTAAYGLQGTTYVYRANSLHDPEFAVLGHQPRGYDQIMAFYKRYTVMSCKMTVTSNWCDGNGARDPLNIIIATRDTSTAYTGSEIMNSYLENPDRTLRTLGPVQSRPTITTRSLSVKKRLGVSNVMDTQELGALLGENPAKEVYFHLHVGPVDPAVLATENVTHQIRLDFIAVFSEAVTIGQS